MSAALAKGTVIDGRYTLDESIGEGTFGDVWRAHDTRVEGRLVAIKLLKAEYLSSPEVVARFEGEAAALVKLSHPNVVTILDRGTWPGGRYLVLEYVEGETLDQWLEGFGKARRLPPLDEVRDLFDQIAAGVEAAHDVKAPNAITHRDLKPANVMISRDKKGRKRVKVLDFGIARLGQRQRTQSGYAMGTPLYMAPEQASMQHTLIAPATDVFALGVILVEMLTLRQEPEEDKLWCAKVMEGDGDTAALIKSLRSSLPPSLCDAIAKALRRDPKQRFADAGELRDEVANAWGGEAGRRAEATPTPLPAEPPKEREPVAQERTVPAKPLMVFSEKGETVPVAQQAPPSEPASPAKPPSGARAAKGPPWLAVGLIAAAGLVAVAVILGVRKKKTQETEPEPPPPPSPSECPEGMAKIEGGTFKMGSNDFKNAQPVHDETVKTFCMDKTEVTVAAYRACKDEGKCTKPDKGIDCNWDKTGRENHPSNCVDWQQAKAYCASKGKRLPTEAEWELAARGLQGKKYPWGEDDPSDQLCWDGERRDLGRGKRLSTCEVGAYPKGTTKEGVADLAGNVLEWVEDYYCPSYDRGKECNKNSRVIRGGGWILDGPSVVRGAFRSRYDPAGRVDNLGFRCAR